MAIEFRCRCGSLLTAEPAGVAQTIRCPMCFEFSEVPAGEDSVQRSAAMDLPTRADPEVVAVAPAPLADASHSAGGLFAGSAEFPPERLDKPHLKRLRWTAAVMIVAAMVQAIPVGCYGDAALPVWMRAILILAAAQVAFWLWVVLVPDWSTMWIATLLAAGTATFYAFALAIAVATPVGEPDLLEMDSLRALAELWLTAMLLLYATTSLACGQISFQWRKALA